MLLLLLPLVLKGRDSPIAQVWRKSLVTVLHGWVEVDLTAALLEWHIAIVASICRYSSFLRGSVSLLLGAFKSQIMSLVSCLLLYEEQKY